MSQSEEKPTRRDLLLKLAQKNPGLLKIFAARTAFLALPYTGFGENFRFWHTSNPPIKPDFEEKESVSNYLTAIFNCSISAFMLGFVEFDNSIFRTSLLKDDGKKIEVAITRIVMSASDVARVTARNAADVADYADYAGADYAAADYADYAAAAADPADDANETTRRLLQLFLDWELVLDKGAIDNENLFEFLDFLFAPIVSAPKEQVLARFRQATEAYGLEYFADRIEAIYAGKFTFDDLQEWSLGKVVAPLRPPHAAFETSQFTEMMLRKFQNIDWVAWSLCRLAWKDRANLELIENPDDSFLKTLLGHNVVDPRWAKFVRDMPVSPYVGFESSDAHFAQLFWREVNAIPTSELPFDVPESNQPKFWFTWMKTVHGDWLKSIRRKLIKGYRSHASTTQST